MMGSRDVAVLLACLPGFLGPGPPAADGRPGSKIWVGRHQEIEEYLRTADCVSMEVLVPGRFARCTLRPGGPVARMAWKHLPPGVYRGFRESYKAEIAAYELDKLLRLDMVPPSVERQLEGRRGAAQLWVEDVTNLTGEASPGAPDQADWANQVIRMRMFDDLIGNRDRNRGNMLRDAAGNLILLDHSRAFGKGTDFLHKRRRIDEDLWVEVEALTPGKLEAALGAWLDRSEIKAVLDRRDKMRAEARSLPRQGAGEWGGPAPVRAVRVDDCEDALALRDPGADR
jgi:hypothetical protein